MGDHHRSYTRRDGSGHYAFNKGRLRLSAVVAFPSAMKPLSSNSKIGTPRMCQDNSIS